MPVTARRNPAGSRKHLNEAEVDALVQAAGEGRWGVRNRAVCLVMFYHGLRVSELCGLKLSDWQEEKARLFVRRVKGSLSTEQPVNGTVLRAMNRYLKIRAKSGFEEIFLNERGEPLSSSGVQRIVRRAGENACLAFSVHPHMLRHACGYALVNRPNGSRDLRLIQDYLGHRDPRHTMKYAALAPGRFEDLWK